MRGIRGKRVKTAKEGTLIATVDIGMTTNMGYWTAAIPWTIHFGLPVVPEENKISAG